MERRKKSFKFFKIIVMLLVALFLVRGVQQVYMLYRVRQETKKTEAMVKELEDKKKALEKEKQNLGDLKYVEKIAREEHNMVRKGEIPLFIIDDKNKAKQENGKSEEQKMDGAEIQKKKDSEQKQ